MVHARWFIGLFQVPFGQVSLPFGVLHLVMVLSLLL